MTRLASSRSAWGLLALLAVALAYAWPAQVNGYEANSHYALVRSLAAGTPTVERALGEIGELSSGDVHRYRGHTYSDKAPGLAFTALPAFLAVREAGMRTTGDPTEVIWALHVWSIVLPALLLLLAVRALAERLEPGLGTAAAVTLGLGTLVLPFATLFFAHVPATALGFAAFALLWHERDGPPRLGLVAAAGAGAGLAVTTEYPLGLVAIVLALYALARGPRLQRALAFAAGAFAGVVPLLLYDWWAFGSITRISYSGSAPDRAGGFFGISTPSARVMFDLLFSTTGLLTIAPVVVCALAGTALLYRRGRRLEAGVIGALCVLYLLYDSGYFDPFGGLGPGPRFLIPVLPFLAVPLALAYRAFPVTTAALGAVSAFQLVAMTATGALASYDGDWLGRLGRHAFAQTGASVVGVTGWYAMLPFFAAVLAAVGCTVLATRGVLRVPRREAAVAPLALLIWAIVAIEAPDLHGAPFRKPYALAVFGVLSILAVTVVALRAEPGVARVALRPRKGAAP